MKFAAKSLPVAAIGRSYCEMPESYLASSPEWVVRKSRVRLPLSYGEREALKCGGVGDQDRGRAVWNRRGAAVSMGEFVNPRKKKEPCGQSCDVDIVRPSMPMIHLLIRAVHLLFTIANLPRSGGVRAVVAEFCC